MDWTPGSVWASFLLLQLVSGAFHINVPWARLKTQTQSVPKQLCQAGKPTNLKRNTIRNFYPHFVTDHVKIHFVCVKINSSSRQSSPYVLGFTVLQLKSIKQPKTSGHWNDCKQMNQLKQLPSLPPPPKKKKFPSQLMEELDDTRYTMLLHTIPAKDGEEPELGILSKHLSAVGTSP